MFNPVSNGYAGNLKSKAARIIFSVPTFSERI